VIKVRSLIVFLDLRKLTSRKDIADCRELAEYACYLANERGVRAQSIMAMLPDGSITESSVRTQDFSKNMLSAVSDELEFVEGVGVLEHLGEASRIPEDLKTVCGEHFRPVKPFSHFFDAKASDDFRQEYLRHMAKKKKGKTMIPGRYRKPETLMRGGRQK